MLLCRSLFFILAFSISTVALCADKNVAVIIGYNKTYPNGASKRVMPPEPYRALLRSCGIAENLGKEQFIPYSKLLCAGVLDTSQSEQYQARLRKQVDALKRKNIQKIGTINLDEIYASINRTQFGISRWMVVQSINDSPGSARRAAVNFQENGLVVLNLPLWEFATNPEFTDLMLMHELLGANGNKDRNYTVSLALWWLARQPERIAELSRKLPNLITYRAILAEREGISVTGHGGDFAEIIFKASLLDATLKPLELSDASGLVRRECYPKTVDIEAMILTSPITSAPSSVFVNSGACAMPGSGEQRLEACGGFILKGAGNQPVIMITDAWGTYAKDNQRWPLVMKVYTDIISQLAQEIQRNGCRGN